MPEQTEQTESNTPLFATERQERILETARREGRVDVATLSGTFGVTAETIRRDLNRLEEVGVLRRVHGGAVPIERMVVPGVAQRSETMEAEKRAIGAAAIAEVPLGGAILIDSGTTTARIVDAFPQDRELTVVTNSLPIAQALVELPRLVVFHLGGRIRQRTLASVEAWTLHGLNEVSVDIAFLGTYGISIERGLTTPDPSEGAVKRAMVAAARRVVVLADHSKLGAEHLSRFASLSDVDLLITDEGASEAGKNALTQAGLQVRTAPYLEGPA